MEVTSLDQLYEYRVCLADKSKSFGRIETRVPVREGNLLAIKGEMLTVTHVLYAEAESQFESANSFLYVEPF